MVKLSAEKLGRFPNSTYRLQLNRIFTFKQALVVTEYLKRLGISDCYSSPILRARSGSTHCYDVTDHREINPEIGTLEDFQAWASQIRSKRMGLLVDIVPNHMALSNENHLLMEVLEFGQFSKYSTFFDIDWNREAKDLSHRIKLPILPSEFRNILKDHEISVFFSEKGFALRLYGNTLPLTPRSYVNFLKPARELLVAKYHANAYILEQFENLIEHFEKLPNSSSRLSTEVVRNKDQIRSLSIKQEINLQRFCGKYGLVRDALKHVLEEFNNTESKKHSRQLRSLLAEQFYKLGYWKTAISRINYRRFSTVNDLIAIRVEERSVYDEAHRLILELVSKGRITGLRVDHIDGLLEPAEYLHRLQESCQKSLAYSKMSHSLSDHPKKSGRSTNSFYITVEKILEQSERLPRSWDIEGTTGYEFLRDVNGIFVDSRNAQKFDDIYSKFISKNFSFEQIVRLSRKRIIASSMQSDLESLTRLLFVICRDLGHGRCEFQPERLSKAMEEIASSFEVYRTYATSKSIRVRGQDRRYVENALSAAIEMQPSTMERLDVRIYDLIRRILLLDFPSELSKLERNNWRLFALRFQQFTAPIAAKGVEDTAFYIYNRLVSLNEVGGDPQNFGVSIEEFHQRNKQRHQTHPHSMLCTSTHDTKRSEDVRARINVLSEIPDRWQSALLRWRDLNSSKKLVVKGRRAPSANDEYLLYQTLLGVWPSGSALRFPRRELLEQITTYMIKAVREAKVETSWVDQDLHYENSLRMFIESILEKSGSGNEFVSDFLKLQKDVCYHGMLNSLSQLLIKLTCPGVPDTYQGDEIWNLSLVDPDNRRPVDFETRKTMLSLIEKRIRTSGNDLSTLATDLLANMEDGLIKMYVMRQVLAFRNKHERMFGNGRYVPIRVVGAKQRNLCCFMRKTDDDDDACLVLAPRFFVSLLAGRRYERAIGCWKDTNLVLPQAMKGTKFHNIFTGRIVTATNNNGYAGIAVAEVLDQFPLGLLYAN